MRYLITLLIFSSFISCNKNSSIKANDVSFEKSYKELKKENMVEFTEFLDSVTNVYSNYKYYVSFDAPDNWKTDMGVSKHTIFRAYEYDSAISFSINVIDVKIENSVDNIWELYKKNKEAMDSPLILVLTKQLNSEIYGLQAEKSYISNHLSLKRIFNYMIRELDFEYENTCIMHQVRVNDFTFTFSLHIPTEFFKKKPDYYNKMFLNIRFLNNEEIMKEHFVK